ncbi:MAG: class I SAM-dependent methyltransferase [Actinomycetota bacterium]
MDPGFIDRPACPVCGSSELRELYRTAYTKPPIRTLLERHATTAASIDWGPLEGVDYVLQECGSCTLIFQRFVPNEALAAIVYEQWPDPDWALQRRERHASARMGQYALEVMQVIEFFGRGPESLRVLDFGMGWGHWVRMAQAFGCQAFGLEVSQSRLDHAAEVGIDVLGPDELGSPSFDFINTEQVFEHLTDPRGTALHLAGSLVPGGVLRISVPNAMRLKGRLRKPDWRAPRGSRRSLGDVTPMAHLNAYNHRALLALGREAGLGLAPIPARLRYRYVPTWQPMRRVLRRTVGLHYRALRHKDTVLWFRKEDGATAPA